VLVATLATVGAWGTFSSSENPHAALQIAGAAPPSTDPYTASLAYARCLRRHGVPHPNPDRKGDFQLTLEQERRLRQVGPKRREAAERACFHHLKGLNLRPLSLEALDRANSVLRELGRCLREKGFKVGTPQSRNLSRGRAAFVFKFVVPPSGLTQAQWLRQQHACERKVNLARRMTKIIDEDRHRFDV